MAIISIAVDTSSRESVITVDGQIVAAKCFMVEKYVDADGVSRLSLSYCKDDKDESGLDRVTYWYLPQPEETNASLNEHGLAQRKDQTPSEVAGNVASFVMNPR
jgi:hypothetical protein